MFKKRHKNKANFIISMLLVICCLFSVTGCSTSSSNGAEQSSGSEKTAEIKISNGNSEASSVSYTTDNIPKWDGKSTEITINNNDPDFTDSEKTETVSSLNLSELDSLGRCGIAKAVLGQDTLATEKRGSIGMVHPTGWHTVRYDDLITTKYLYNRCHLIAYSLSSILADERNLITGTRAMNEAMIPYENEVHDYIEDTGNHVVYKVVPVFEDDNLTVSGIFMEAYSVEDNGKGVKFFKYLYNEQPGVTINHADGTSSRDDGKEADYETAGGANVSDSSSEEEKTYVINVNTKKFHLESCPNASRIAEHNKSTETTTEKMLESQGYEPAKCCIHD